MIILKKWQKNSIVFSLATGLLLSGIILPSVNTVSAAQPQQKQEVQSTNAKHQVILKHMKKLATEGKTVNSENFGIGSAGKDIVKKWGEPTSQYKNYLQYEERNIAFELKSGKVIIIYAQDKRYDNITYQEVGKVFGKPVKQYYEEDSGDHSHVRAIYKVGKRTLTIGFKHNEDHVPTTIESLELK